MRHLAWPGDALSGPGMNAAASSASDVIAEVCGEAVDRGLLHRRGDVAVDVHSRRDC